MQLSVADIEGDDARRPGLEQRVGESPGRGADVETVLSGDVDLQPGKRIRELLAASGDEAGTSLDLELRCLVHLLARLRVPGYATSEDECLCLRAGLGQAALDEQHVQPLFHGRSVAG
jgi:hypothetical protein